MGDIVYTDHLRLRLDIRKIPESYPREIYLNPDQRFVDKVEGYTIAVKKLQYSGRDRNMMIAFEESGNDVTIITIHPISDEKISNRIRSGRWETR